MADGLRALFEFLVWALVWIVALPLVLIVATPIILITASFKAAPYGAAVSGMYRRLWNYWNSMGVWIATAGVLGLMLLIPVVVRCFGSQPTQ